MKKYTAILIDDEISALQGLRQKVERHFPQITIIEVYQKPEDAIDHLRRVQPDLVFLDIEMPRINGFDLLSELESIKFQVIFITAYSEYAIRAFKESAVDYVLKPVDDDELIKAVHKAIAIIEQKQEQGAHDRLMEVMQKVLSKDSKLVVPTTKGLSFIPESEVYHLEGYQGYTRVHTELDNKIVSSYNLGKFEAMLGNTFFKCHKSHIVNLSKVRKFENEGYLVLENGNRVPISKSNRKIFLDLFKAN